MRDAFGGTFMLKLAIIFIVIYISFMAVTINYAKAFRVKNQIINIVEQYQFAGSSDNEVIGIIDDYLREVPYNFSGSNSLENKCKEIAGPEKVNSGDYTYTENGACIISNGTLGRYGSSSRYYKVVTFINIDFSFFDIEMTIPISGETKVIYTKTS